VPTNDELDGYDPTYGHEIELAECLVDALDDENSARDVPSHWSSVLQAIDVDP